MFRYLADNTLYYINIQITKLMLDWCSMLTSWSIHWHGVTDTNCPTEWFGDAIYIETTWCQRQSLSKPVGILWRASSSRTVSASSLTRHLNFRIQQSTPSPTTNNKLTSSSRKSKYSLCTSLSLWSISVAILSLYFGMDLPWLTVFFAPNFDSTSDWVWRVNVKTQNQRLAAWGMEFKN